MDIFGGITFPGYRLLTLPPIEELDGLQASKSLKREPSIHLRYKADTFVYIANGGPFVLIAASSGFSREVVRPESISQS